MVEFVACPLTDKKVKGLNHCGRPYICLILVLLHNLKVLIDGRSRPIKHFYWVGYFSHHLIQ